jgi:peptidoglycan/xylan/chitin deacetylase (PgdA/CDA1 family)
LPIWSNCLFRIVVASALLTTVALPAQVPAATASSMPGKPQAPLTPAPAVVPLQIAVTFDDLPAHGQRPLDLSRLQIAQSILASLKANDMPPTYGFINGAKTEDDPETMQVLNAWRAAGQPLGNHTWSHPDLSKTDAELFIAEIEANQPLLRRLAAISPVQQDWHWFRYPYLQEGETPESHKAVRSWLLGHGYRIAEVTLDFEDYLWNAPYARCLATHNDAALTYLHDSYLSTAERYTEVHRILAQQLYGHDIPYVLLMHIGAFDAHMLPELLALYRAHGFSFISLPQASADPAYASDQGWVYQGGGALTEALTFNRKLPFPYGGGKPFKQLDALCR